MLYLVWVSIYILIIVTLCGVRFSGRGQVSGFLLVKEVDVASLAGSLSSQHWVVDFYVWKDTDVA
jgi:hypothetical protein